MAKYSYEFKLQVVRITTRNFWRVVNLLTVSTSQITNLISTKSLQSVLSKMEHLQMTLIFQKIVLRRFNYGRFWNNC